MTTFLPPRCPNELCPTWTDGVPFLWCHAGKYPRKADGRRVQRYLCRVCRRRFSSQSFRLDWRLRKPHVNASVLGCLVSKVTQRQAARILRLDRKTIHHRIRLFSAALREFHWAHLDRARETRSLAGAFSLDELETYEHDRRLMPLTVPVLIHRSSRFVVGAEVGRLPARGNLRPFDQARRRTRGPRPNESSMAVRGCLEQLRRALHPSHLIEITTDRKASYRPLIKQTFPGRLAVHVRESSRRTRNTSNVLFQINLTLAMMRDQIARLVRRTWAASKLRSMLRRHVWIWIAWRNYVRLAAHDEQTHTAAMLVGIAPRRYASRDLLRWRHPSWHLVVGKTTRT